MSSQNALCQGGNPATNCSICPKENMTSWEHTMDQLYTVFYLIIFIPGLLSNSLALLVLGRLIRKKAKAIIFMINLALADLLHVLSLPLRIYYYFNHTWPFGKGLCLVCFYLKYLNMYAGIVFLVCISIQRCAFLMLPFCTRKWKRRYDARISAVVWLVAGLCCSPFILMRSSIDSSSKSCFKDLPMRKLNPQLAIAMIASAELLGFVIPLAIIMFCAYCIARSLRNGLQAQQSDSDKRKALRMVLVCTGVFLFCFAPYHVNFLLYLMVTQDVITSCPIRLEVKYFHPISVCMASLSCCLNPIIYYFLTTEFRQQLSHHRSRVLRGRLMILGSSFSFRE
ncbi:hypothetical protein JZ751_021990 [Albula glossodonta]|uniref:G-protein coupled receptors family 1 profile domain-containing protein n=1 Tax=Albula glossodonta TaxID=121402 RepID=A0A8T2NLH1_9TELE|nr:hypothetical protein JZ751_021990 [Albula glossodonta]